MDSSYNISDTLFQSDSFIVNLTNNERELIGKRQQGGILSAVRGDLCKFVKEYDSDPSKLGR